MASKSIDWDEVLVTKKPKQKEIEVSFKKVDGDGYLGFGDETGTPGGATEDENGCVNSISVVSNDQWPLTSGQPHWIWITLRTIPTEEYTVTLTFTDGTLLNASGHYNTQTLEWPISPGSWESNEEGVTGIKVPLTLGDVTDLTDVGIDTASYNVEVTAVDGLGVDCWGGIASINFAPEAIENPPEDTSTGGEEIPGDNPECTPHDCDAWVDFQAIPYSGWAVMPTYSFGTNGSTAFSGDRVYPFPINGYDSPNTDGDGSYGFFASLSPERGMLAQVQSQGWEPATEYYRAPGQFQPNSANVGGGGYQNRMPLLEGDRVRIQSKSWTFSDFEDPTFTLNCGNGLSYTFMQFGATGSWDTQNRGMKKPWILTTSGQDPYSNYSYWDDYKTDQDPSYSPPLMLLDHPVGPMYSMRHAEYLTWVSVADDKVNAVPDGGVQSFLLTKGAYSYHYITTSSGGYSSRVIINTSLYMQWDFDYSASQCKITLSRDTINPLAVMTVPKSQMKGWVEVEFTNYYQGTKLTSPTAFTREIKTVATFKIGNSTITAEYFDDGPTSGNPTSQAVSNFYHPYANGASDGACPVPLLNYPFYGSNGIKDSSGNAVYAMCAAVADPAVGGTPNAMKVFDRQFQQYITPDYCSRIN